jgi:DNA-binding CsgD family transcriptional regulator
MKTAARQFDGARTGWSSLTATEEQVAEFVSQGLTNRQVANRLYMSHHTVDSHLRHIYWKLGINSRIHLTRLFIERAYEGLSATA